MPHPEPGFTALAEMSDDPTAVYEHNGHEYRVLNGVLVQRKHDDAVEHIWIESNTSPLAFLEQTWCKLDTNAKGEVV